MPRTSASTAVQALPLLAASFFLVAAAAAAHAQPGAAPVDCATACVAPASCANAHPPCGYINPILDLDFPSKPKCAATLGVTDPAACIPLPAENGTVRYAGVVRWYWKESEDLVYAPDPNSPIQISFAGTSGNPSWLTFKVDPPTFTITAQDLVDPRNSKVDNSGSAPVVYYWYERAINVTFTRTGSPDAAGLDDLRNKDGILEVYVRGKSTASGTTYNAGFGGEYFRFNATGLLQPASQPVKASPPSILAPFLALVAITLLRRRR